MLFLTAIYEEMSLSYSVLGLTEKECRAVMNEKIAAAALLWDEENYDEEGEFLTRSNMASVCLKHFQEWGWLKQDYDEALNSYVVTFPEYSQMYVELFRSLLDEQESEERESVMTIYSHLYTYSSDKEKNNEILKSALRVSKKLVQMLVNMQDGMRGYFDELSRQKDFRGIQDVLVKEINNSDSRKYAILTTTDSFYRYKEAVKELLDRNLQENDMSRLKLLRELEEVRQKKMKDEENAGKVKDPKKTDEAEKIKELRLERAAAMCEEAADTLIRIERQFDAIERRYNKLIEQKTIFASRAAARIRYVLQEGAEEDRTVALVDLLNKSRRKEEISEKLAERILLSRPHRALTDESLYKRKEKGREAFVPAAVSEGGQAEENLESFVLKPLYTRKELQEFKERNSVGNVFRTTRQTVRSAEDLEKLFFIWQEATENAFGSGEITVGEEEETEQGMRFSTLEIREDYVMFEYLESISITEGEQIKKTIQALFRQTCILQVKYDPATLVPKDNVQYEICVRHRHFIEDYLSVLGCELTHDAQEHIFCLTGDGAAREKLNMTETVILLIIKLIYKDKIMGEGLNAPVTTLKEMREYGKNTNLIVRKLKADEWKASLYLMRLHQIIDVPGAVRDVEDDTPIYIYSTINLYVTAKDMNDLIEEYREEADGYETAEENFYKNADQ